MSKKKKKSGVSTQIWGTIITTVGVILVALFAFPPFQRIFEPAPSSTTVPTTGAFSISTAIFQPDTLTPSPTYSDTYTPTLTPTETFTPTPPSITFTPSAATTGLPIGMQVNVTPNPPRGKAPLSVKLDARDSFVRAPDGTLFECRRGGCRYVWYIYLNGKPFIEPRETNGTLEIKFDKRGNYFVSVYICHGADSPTCASGGTVVIVE
jgi:hypothetical protein